MVFKYTPTNNSLFRIPELIPYARIENGWLNATTYNPLSTNDHHLVTINTSNGDLQEQYEYYTTERMAVARHALRRVESFTPTQVMRFLQTGRRMRQEWNSYP